MKISKFKKMANNKYRIYLEDGTELDTYDEVILTNNLLFKKEIDLELSSKILEDNKYYNAYNKCIKILSSKLKSKYEIEKYLESTLDKENIDKIINKLESIGLLNDTRYTRAYIKDKVNFTTQGPNKIYDDLVNKNINPSIILNELNNIDLALYENKIDKYIEKKIKGNKKSNYLFKQKMINDLMTMGFDKEMILSHLNDFKVEENIDYEFNKVYSKLSRKYSGNELKNNIKNKLYQKGYSKDTIEKAIEKMDI